MKNLLRIFKTQKNMSVPSPNRHILCFTKRKEEALIKSDFLVQLAHWLSAD